MVNDLEGAKDECFVATGLRQIGAWLWMQPDFFFDTLHNDLPDILLDWQARKEIAGILPQSLPRVSRPRDVPGHFNSVSPRGCCHRVEATFARLELSPLRDSAWLPPRVHVA